MDMLMVKACFMCPRCYGYVCTDEHRLFRPERPSACHRWTGNRPLQSNDVITAVPILYLFKNLFLWQNPDYHGFSDDPFVDEWNMRLAFFFGISMAIVIGGTFIHYLPDHGWAGASDQKKAPSRLMRIPVIKLLPAWCFFLSLSCPVLCWCSMRQWARREAERLIVLREAEGLPLINENYYDPSKIVFPSSSDE